MRKHLLATAALLAVGLAAPMFAQMAFAQTAFAQNAPGDQTTGQMQHGTNGSGTVDLPNGQPGAMTTGQSGDMSGDQTTGQMQHGANGSQTVVVPSGGTGAMTTGQSSDMSGDQTTGQMQHGTDGSQTVVQPNGQPGKYTNGQSMAVPPIVDAPAAQIGNAAPTTSEEHDQVIDRTAAGQPSWSSGHEPRSTAASNITSSDTHSTIAPALPIPPVGASATPDQYLRAAQRALDMHRSGEAQEALERAETRLLDRSTAADAANTPDQGERVRKIHQALDSIAKRDWQSAKADIDGALKAAPTMANNAM